MIMDITSKIGSFSPFLFVYLNTISEIDISGCRSIDANEFTDCVLYCKKLEKLTMTSCTQFSEGHFLQFLPRLTNLYLIDLARCQEIAFVGSFFIVQSIESIRYFNFEPKNPQEDVSDWELLLRNIRRVHFGHNVMVCMPHYGNHWRIEYESEEDVNEE